MPNRNILIIAVVLSVIVLLAVAGFYVSRPGGVQPDMPREGTDASVQVEAERVRLENSLSQVPGIAGGGYEDMMKQVGGEILAIEKAYPEMKGFTAVSGQIIEREENDGVYYFAFLVRKPQGAGFSRSTCYSVDTAGVVAKTGELTQSEIGDAQVIGPRTCKPLGHLDLGA